MGICNLVLSVLQDCIGFSFLSKLKVLRQKCSHLSLFVTENRTENNVLFCSIKIHTWGLKYSVYGLTIRLPGALATMVCQNAIVQWDVWLKSAVHCVLHSVCIHIQACVLPLNYYSGVYFYVDLTLPSCTHWKSLNQMKKTLTTSSATTEHTTCNQLMNIIQYIWCLHILELMLCISSISHRYQQLS